MSNAIDVNIKLLVKNRELTNSSTGDKFTIRSLDGYTTYKGSPVKRVRGKFLEPRTYKDKEGKPFTLTKAILNFYDSEEISDDFKDEGTLFLKIDTRVNRSNKNEFEIANTDILVFDDFEDKRNFKGYVLGDLRMPLNGIIESNTITDGFGDSCQRLNLNMDNKYAMNKVANDMLSKGEDKVGYVVNTATELFTDEDLALLSENFKFFKGFISQFEEAADRKDTITAAKF